MKTYVGIDLGTTNSVICSFDGEATRLYKSPDQNDVTPSAIFIDRRGNRFVGARAYNNAARNPENAATKFKRVMGTGTPIKFSAVDVTMTPEECSAEILKVLFGYLPEEVRNSDETGTVITVPAAFNQMQKDATMSAAEAAGLGKVALMQEPVAAVMSVMRQRKGDGVFLVYDLGGGTLDIAIAQSIAGRVSLLSHGGIAMCGGTDFDREILHNVVKPWLHDNFDLPDDLIANPQYKGLLRMATWAAEKAKIEISSKDEVVIGLSESELGVKDQAGQEVYLDIVLKRGVVDELISQRIRDSIDAAREALEKAGLTAHDVERVVFVGGPTQYKPLRDLVAFELGIAGSTEVNPMTAVAEGAAVFAESIDWASESRGRKAPRGAVSSGGKVDLTFNYVARTPGSKAKVVAKLGRNPLPNAEFQIESPETGWNSGRLRLTDGASVDVILSKPGENNFKVWVFDSAGGPVAFENNKLTITRTAATIDAIPSSCSIAFEVLDKLGGNTSLEFLVKEGDALPAKGKIRLIAAESLKAGSSGALRFKLWEGDIEHQVDNNRPIGMFKISGTDFVDGVIAAGAELQVEYEVLDSGNVMFEVSVPSIRATFPSGRILYSRQEGQINLNDASRLVIEDAEAVRRRVEAVAEKVESPRLDEALDKLDQASTISPGESDPEAAKQAMDNVLHAKRLLAQVRREHLKEMRQMDLDRAISSFEEDAREYARPAEVSTIENLMRTAQRAIDSNSNDFESHLDQLQSKRFMILWREDWFVIARFKSFAEHAYLFPDRKQHAALVAAGMEALRADEIDRLRQIMGDLYSLRVGVGTDDEMAAVANVVRGSSHAP
jgi:molecular chaperone DnaK